MTGEETGGRPALAEAIDRLLPLRKLQAGPELPLHEAPPGARALTWRKCTLIFRSDKRMTVLVPVADGTGEPDATRVLAAVARQAAACDDAGGDFYRWCEARRAGWDSISAYQEFTLARKQGSALRRLLGPDYGAIVAAARDDLRADGPGEDAGQPPESSRAAVLQLLPELTAPFIDARLRDAASTGAAVTLPCRLTPAAALEILGGRRPAGGRAPDEGTVTWYAGVLADEASHDREPAGHRFVMLSPGGHLEGPSVLLHAVARAGVPVACLAVFGFERGRQALLDVVAAALRPPPAAGPGHDRQEPASMPS